MNVSADADNGIVSAVCSSFQSEEGKQLKKRLTLVAQKHGQGRRSGKHLDVKQQQQPGNKYVVEVSNFNPGPANSVDPDHQLNQDLIS